MTGFDCSISRQIADWSQYHLRNGRCTASDSPGHERTNQLAAFTLPAAWGPNELKTEEVIHYLCRMAKVMFSSLFLCLSIYLSVNNITKIGMKGFL